MGFKVLVMLCLTCGEDEWEIEPLSLQFVDHSSPADIDLHKVRHQDWSAEAVRDVCLADLCLYSHTMKEN